ncbi:MAG: gluconate 2-dehydrogenase subunit 3 family protein [Chitinophagaceae bacterium]|nr:MAG: gluconate 2-dehydrogenase subunit 3 family protein [Chitinophagaceae bacterium]
MNRKKAIFSMFVLGGGVAATYSGYKFYSISRQPDFAFLENNILLIAELAETLIPATDTPGARDVQAELAIVSLIKKAADKKTQNNFIEGLKDVNGFANDQYDKEFTQLTKPQKQEVVSHFARRGKNFSGLLGKARNKLLGKSFFDILKYYTTVAYCTSRKGATQALAYDYVPGKYQGCIPLTAGQKSWATK